MMKIEAGQVLGGSYRVIRRIGTGGMSEVYEVEHRQLGVHYALKTFTLSHGSVELLKKRFLAEGKVLSRLKHPNIIHVHDLDFDVVTGTPYFVMDLVLDKNGEPRTLETIRPDDIEASDAKRWFEQMCCALDYIHAHDIIHRDIKPSNILLDQDGNAVLSDFGISRYADENLRRQLGVTKEFANGRKVDVTRQMLLGTEAYMAPEIRLGRGVVSASDAYSLGLVFFKLLTGVWFEPRQGVLNLLEPLGGDWLRLLPPLLKDNPAERPTALSEHCGETRTKAEAPAQVRPKIFLWLWAIATLTGLLCLGLSAWKRADRGVPQPLPTPEEYAEEYAEADIERMVRNVLREPDTGVCDLARKTGEPFTMEEDNAAIRMLWCAPGKASLGSPDSEEGRFANETQRVVTLTKGFWLSQTEVTQGQWQRLMGQTILDLTRISLSENATYEQKAANGEVNVDYTSPLIVNVNDPPQKWCGKVDEKMPVYHVNWNQAMEFCRKLTEREKQRGHLPSDYEYRLPTEAEWEYACRAGSQTVLPGGRTMEIFGENNAPGLGRYAWYGGNSSWNYRDVGFSTLDWREKQYPGGRAAPRTVATREANDWGFHDMLGNVIEWCYDWYGAAGAASVTDPYGPDYGTCHVVKGGSWKMPARFCRPAYRDGFAPGVGNFIGFRVALAPIIRRR